jgi:hypothetical protein
LTGGGGLGTRRELGPEGRRVRKNTVNYKIIIILIIILSNILSYKF